MSEEIKETFLKNVQNHEITVLLDAGVYRHLRFKKNDRSEYWFDVVTYPGHLAISGDMGCSVFSRLDDMFRFFRNEKLEVNSGYFAEKCQANDGEIMVFSEEKFKQVVKDIFDDYFSNRDEDENTEKYKSELWGLIESEVVSDVESSGQAIDRMYSFESFDGDFNFSDAWEYENQIQEYDYHFVWRLYAIVWAIQQYDKLKEQTID